MVNNDVEVPYREIGPGACEVPEHLRHLCLKRGKLVAVAGDLGLRPTEVNRAQRQIASIYKAPPSVRRVGGDTKNSTSTDMRHVKHSGKGSSNARGAMYF